MFDDLEPKGKLRGTNKHRINADYMNKKHKRTNPLPAITLDAVCNAGNPNPLKARVFLRYDDTMGVSVFVSGAPLRKNDYVSFYSVKEALTGDQY